MGSFGRKLSRRHSGKLGQHAIDTEYAEMLRYGRTLIDRQDGAFEYAEDHVLAIVDARDRVGAIMADAQYEQNDALGEDEQDALIHARMASAERSQHPYVAFWIPRGPGLLDWLRAEGADVPADWAPALECAPQAGNVWTFLRRKGRHLLMSVDYTQVEPIELPDGPEANADG